MRTLVTFFTDAFNTSQQKPEFINENNFGDDLAAELSRKLGGDAVDQEDHGWYFSFDVPSGKYDLIVGSIDESPGEWVAWIERQRGFLGSLFGQRHRNLQIDAAQAVHQAVLTLPGVRDVLWHDESDRGTFESGQPEPG